jgi:hypothetical protein
MRRSETVRIATLGLALVHTFPARRHLGAFFLRPGLTEAWEGFGALVAVVLYCLPVAVQVRAITALWRRRPLLLRAGGLLLATVHAVPACDHLPRLLAHGRWYDAWRGVGSAIAVLWFLAPLRLQGKAIAAIARFGRLRPERVTDRFGNAQSGQFADHKDSGGRLPIFGGTDCLTGPRAAKVPRKSRSAGTA